MNSCGRTIKRHGDPLKGQCRTCGLFDAHLGGWFMVRLQSGIQVHERAVQCSYPGFPVSGGTADGCIQAENGRYEARCAERRPCPRLWGREGRAAPAGLAGAYPEAPTQSARGRQPSAKPQTWAVRAGPITSQQGLLVDIKSEASLLS